MSTIQLPGLQSGIDTGLLVDQLMALERRTLEAYQVRRELWEERDDALSELQTKLSNLRSAASGLSDAESLRAYTVQSSDTDYITAEASNNAFEGNHTVVVNQLATAERWVHTAGKEYAEDYVGAGTFIYSYDNKETSITTTATTTLSDLVGLINNDADNPGVTAGMLYYNDAYHLVLNGNEAGSDYRVSINASSTEVWKSDSAFTDDSDNAALATRITDLDQFAWNGDTTFSGDEQIQITGTDHNGNAIAQVNLSVNSNTKLSHIVDEINDAFDGIATATLENGKIILTDKAAGASGLSITLTYDQGSGETTLTGLGASVTAEGGATTAGLSGFAQSDFTQTQAAQNSLIQVDGYPAGSATSEVQTMSRNPDPTSGTYTLTYEGQTTAAIANNANPAAIQVALEALSTINAGDVTVAGGANGLGSGDITFTFSDTLGDVSMISGNGTNLGPGSQPIPVVETTKGVPAYISRSSNTVDDVIYGVTLHLHDTTDASGEELTLTRDIESVKEKIDSFVLAYNNAVEFIEEKTAYNKEEKTAGVLMSDYVVSTINYRFREPIIEQTAGFIQDIDAFLTPLDIGLDIDRNGVLSFDTSKFDEAVAEDYLAVLEVIGADKAGSSTSDTITFYGASSNYTTGGEYDVQVTVSGGVITSAQIKLSDESTYRDMTITGNVITGISTFDSNGDPDYAENGLQLAVDLGADGVFTATIRVKQGFAGKIEDEIDRMLKITTGSLILDQQQITDEIEYLDEKIELEEYRLTRKEEYLIRRFAYLEKTLALLQNQLAAAGVLSSSVGAGE
ncbi:MAG TPA: flagellar filament capping protein FliD [Sedimentisphaerales bacterium]|nr:flagellar filament capping protein FliD [Sedimentisphaerales bacterium]